MTKTTVVQRSACLAAFIAADIADLAAVRPRTAPRSAAAVLDESEPEVVRQGKSNCGSARGQLGLEQLPAEASERKEDRKSNREEEEKEEKEKEKKKRKMKKMEGKANEETGKRAIRVRQRTGSKSDRHAVLCEITPQEPPLGKNQCPLLANLDSTEPRVAEFVARLLNAICSLREGKLVS
ncbi:unnamed protein product [Protopolystoma xenopodis]|uniref:Uncharacterized protein n=1 Tax=Protopolystoma xenopodis TaxID=117903 RepID=A0A3S5ATB9_9PLAT|nr:unnamed protein product [Protopolystoma xenopodis]